MLSENLRKLRKNAKKSQTQIANKLNVAQTTYSKYELGTAEPNISTLINLAKIYNTSIDELVGYRHKDIETTINQKEILEMLQNLDNFELQNVKAYIKGIIDNKK